MHPSVWHSPALIRRVRQLHPLEICLLATRFAEAESSTVRRVSRSVARHFALDAGTPGIFTTLERQLELSEATTGWEHEHGLDPETAADARAAVLDMGLVISTPTMPLQSATDLAEPWVSTI